MGYKCCILQCKTNYATTGEKGNCAEFPKDEELKQQWIRFVKRKDWVCTKYSRLCLLHFDERYIKVGKSNRYLNRKLNPVPTIHTDRKTPPSLLVSVTKPRDAPVDRGSYQPAINTELFPIDNDTVRSSNDFTERFFLCPQ